MTTRALADFVIRIGFDDLPASLVDRLKVYTLDALAIGFISRDLPWVEIVRSLVTRQGGTPESSAFGVRDRLPAPRAALLNGVAIGGFELDHGGFLAHPASTVLPAVLAAAEATRASGSEFLCAMALGYEVACRVGKAQTRATEDVRGFHNPGLNGPFGAAAGVGKLLELDAATMVSALGIAGSHAGGTTEYLADGTMTKRLHLGLAAEGGVQSARLAQAGFTGPATILEGGRGVLAAFSPAPDAGAIDRELGVEWLAARMRIKRYPCHGALQSAVAAVQDLRQNNSLTTESLRAIHVEGGAGDRLLQDRFLHPHPRSLIEAQYSTPFTLAVAALRDLRLPHSYDHRVLVDSEVVGLAQRVTWRRTHRAATTITLDCGAASYDITIDDGHMAGGPDSLPGAIERLHSFTATMVPVAARESIASAVRSLESAPDVAALASAIRENAEQADDHG
jgi:2-methylcitrate dehydratase PrpD